MTPMEYRIAVKAYETRTQDAREREITHAWFTAVFALQGLNGKLPSLEVALSRIRPRRVPNLAVQQAQLAMLSEHLGIPVRPASPEALDALRRMKES